MTPPSTKWNAKGLNRDVTNLELWLLVATGFALGRFAGSRWFWLALLGTWGLSLAIDWWRAHCGLDQWPNPRGPYYRRWIDLKEPGDYYEWLAQQCGNREPWSEWARRERS